MVIIIETNAQFSYSVNTTNNSVHRAILLNCLKQFVEHSHIEIGTIQHIVNTVPSLYLSGILQKVSTAM